MVDGMVWQFPRDAHHEQAFVKKYYNVNRRHASTVPTTKMVIPTIYSCNGWGCSSSVVGFVAPHAKEYTNSQSEPLRDGCVTWRPRSVGPFGAENKRNVATHTP